MGPRSEFGRSCGLPLALRHIVWRTNPAQVTVELAVVEPLSNRSQPIEGGGLKGVASQATIEERRRQLFDPAAKCPLWLIAGKFVLDLGEVHAVITSIRR